MPFITNSHYLRKSEAGMFFVLGIILYAHSDYSWWLFILLFFTPDLGVLGYLKNRQFGATCYNITHFAGLPVLLGALAAYSGDSVLRSIAIIWFTHINFDRVLGWGFKTGGAFHETDLGVRKPIGQKSS